MKSVLLIALLGVALAENFAFVVGGANIYPGHSSPCRTYEDLVRGGIKRENIIYMQDYNEALITKNNPWPNMIFTEQAPNTERDHAKYGCFQYMDYIGKEVGKEVYLGVIAGDVERVKKATGKENPKMLKAGPNDNVFMYFIAHGNIGYIGVGKDRVTDKELQEAIMTAYTNKRYGKFVYYMEACHGGSMWEKLPKDINAYAMTAADRDHVGYMSNCPPNDVVADKHIKACLGSVWDNAFQNDFETNPHVTIHQNFETAKAITEKAAFQGVSQWGDVDQFNPIPVSDFLGNYKSKSPSQSKPKSAIAWPEVERHLALWDAIRATSAEEKVNSLEALQTIVMERAKLEIEAMKLGVMFYGEQAADLAMKFGNTHFETDCVRDLLIGLEDQCHFSGIIPESVTNIVKNICLPGLQAPNVDWTAVCM